MSMKQRIRAKAQFQKDYEEFEPTPIGVLIERYLKNVEATASSRQTLTTYIENLNIFKMWLEEECNGLETPITDFNNSESLNGFYIYLDKVRGNKQVTIVTRKRAICTFFYWMMDNHLMNEFNIRITNAQEEVIKYYTDDEIKRLTKKPNPKDSFVEWSNYVIVLLILATGNRRSTIVGYKIGDFDFETSTITMNRTKSKYGQQIPMHPSLKRPLRNYIKTFRSDASDSEPMFPNEFGEEMAPPTLTHRIAKYNISRGVEKTSIHSLRHTFARNWVRSGGDSLLLQRMLGHASLNMTEKYVRLFRNDLVDAVGLFASINAVPDIIEKPQRSKIRKRGVKAAD